MPVRVKWGDRSTTTYALLDSGATCEAILDEVAYEIDAEIESRPCNLSTFNSKIYNPDTEFAKFTVEPLDGSFSIDVNKALVGNILSAENERPLGQSDVKGLDYLSDITIEELPNKTIGVILGSRYAYTWATNEFRFESESKPLAIKTMFSWCLIGPPLETLDKTTSLSTGFAMIETEEKSLQKEVDYMLRHDFIMKGHEAFSPEQTHLSVNDYYSLKQMKDTLYFDLESGHWVCGVPWKNGREAAAKRLNSVDTFTNAKNRLLKEKVKFEKDPVRKAGVFAQMNETLSLGHARIITDLKAPEGSPCVYLPIHVVWRADKPNKYRICLDAASKNKGIFLNGELLSGPDLLNNLLGVLWRWRRKRYPLSADVKGFFHQILIHPLDISAFRFLWFESETMENIVVAEHLAHIFGASSSPPVSNFTLQHHAKEVADLFESDIVRAILEQFYMDDYIDSLDSIEEARQMRKDLTMACKLGGFELTKWESPYPEILTDETDSSPQKNDVENHVTEPEEDENFAEPLEVDFEEFDGEGNVEKISEIFHTPEYFKQDVNQMMKPTSETTPTSKILGTGYDPKTDSLYVRVSAKADVPVLTRRDFLRLTASNFDPYGAYAPCTLQGKILYQIVNDMGLKYDEELPKEISKEVNDWRISLQNLKNLRISRWTSALGYEDAENWLVGFSDASLVGYGCIIYVRKSVKGGGDKPAHVAFLLSKSHVVPLNMHKRILKNQEDHKDSIPKIELEAARLLARKRDELVRLSGENYSKIILMTDSMCVINWLNDYDGRKKTYEHFRLKDIWTLTDTLEWKHIPGEHNPADWCSRGLTAGDPRWIPFHSGPDYLREPMENWPITPTPQKANNPAAMEASREAEFSPLELLTIRVDEAEGEIPSIPPPPSPPPLHWSLEVTKKIEHWDKKVRRVAIFSRFLFLSAKRIFNVKDKKERKLKPSFLFLLPSDLKKSETMIVRAIQYKHFQPEIESLVKLGVNTPNAQFELRKKDSHLRNLSPFLDESLCLRTGGRLGNSTTYSFDQKFSLILPNPCKEEIVKSLIRFEHESNAHSSRLQTFHGLRQRFFIFGGKSAIKRVVDTCTYCQRRDKQPQHQREADLPAERLELTQPFAETGCDVFGPFSLKYTGRGLKKRYVLLFTCFSTRAISLISLKDMSTESFINALIRFHNQFPGLKSLWCDCGSNFKGASRELAESVALWDNEQTNKELAVKGLTWHFGPPHTPHAGGVWERCVQSAKKHIAAIIYEQKSELDLDSFETILSEVSGILNRRPITPMSSDPSDPQTLSPANFLYPYTITPTSVNILPPLSSGDHLRASWRRVREVIEEFWQRWQQEYVIELQRRTKWTSSTKNPRLGQLVILVDELQPRELWRIGRISKILTADKNHVRRVEIDLPNGTKLERHLCKIVPLELDE